MTQKIIKSIKKGIIKRISFDMSLELKNLLHVDEKEVVVFIELLETIDSCLCSVSSSTLGLYTPENISLKIESVLKILYDYKSLGYVKKDYLQKNPILQQFFSLFTNLSCLQTAKTTKFMFELEHVNNIVLLILYMDLLILETEYIFGENDELFFDLMVKKDEILGKITGGVRNALKRKRISFHDRIYMGFDTEFKTLESRKNQLLCFTTSVFSRFVFCIRYITIDFSIDFTKQSFNNPIVSDLIRVLVYSIRIIKGFKDYEVEKLLL
jgi:hypothetical protein